MSDFRLLLETSQAEALANLLDPTEDSIYRRICRSYSQKFATPLDQVFRLDPAFVLMHHYELWAEGIKLDEELEETLEIIYGLENPLHERVKREELKNFIADIEREEAERVAKNIPLHKALGSKKKQKNTSQKQEVKKEKQTQGSIDLSYLEQNSNEK